MFWRWNNITPGQPNFFGGIVSEIFWRFKYQKVQKYIFIAFHPFFKKKITVKSFTLCEMVLILQLFLGFKKKNNINFDNFWLDYGILKTVIRIKKIRFYHWILPLFFLLSFFNWKNRNTKCLFILNGFLILYFVLQRSLSETFSIILSGIFKNF